MASDTQIDIFGMQQTVTPEEMLDLRQRELRNLLTSYADEADVFAEIIQNAFDAIMVAFNHRLYRTGSPAPRIDIVIGRRRGDPHYLLVSDNGIGMSPDVAARFTMPGFTDSKTLGRTIGYKGVGASFFFAASNLIAFQTVDTEGRHTAATVTGSYRWIMNNTEPPPKTEESFTCPAPARDVLSSERGTAIYYECHDNIKPKSLSHIVIRDSGPSRELRHWASYLCAKTAIGQVERPTDIDMRIGLHLDDGERLHSTEWTVGEFNLDEKQLGYPYPWRVFKVHEDISKIDGTPEARRIVQHSGRNQALRLHWSRDELEALQPPLKLSEAEQELVTDKLEFLDLFLAHSTTVLEEIHKRTGARAKVLRYGIRLACEGIPQGRMVDFDLTSHQGLARQAHALLAFRDLEFDTGRKIPADEVVMSVIRKVTVRAMGELVDYRWALKKKARPDPSPDLDGWRSSTREHMSRSIVRELFLRMNKEAPIQVDPDTEHDVVALFAALLATGVLKGYQMLALSGFKQYDGLVNVLTDAPDLRDHTDPFSIRNHEEVRGGEYKILEFKLHFDSILEDFDIKRKRPQDIDLLVCWTLPGMNVRRGTLAYTYGDRNDFREIYGMTHLWTDDGGTSSIPIVCLRHFVTEKLKVVEEEPGIGAASFKELLDQEQHASI